MLAVRKVLSLLGEEVGTARRRLQVIVLDHAGEDVWGNLPDVQLTEEWRDRALVRLEWPRHSLLTRPEAFETYRHALRFA